MKKSKVKVRRVRQALRHKKLTSAAALRAAQNNQQTLDALERAETVRLLGLTGTLAMAVMMGDEED